MANTTPMSSVYALCGRLIRTLPASTHPAIQNELGKMVDELSAPTVIQRVPNPDMPNSYGLIREGIDRGFL